MDRFAVIGNPIEHSLSPRIYPLFAAQTGHQLVYGKIKAELHEFEQAVYQFQREGGKGMNVTLPFKQRAFLLANQTSQRAKLAQAANTLAFLNDGRIYADNTDGYGLVHDLTINHQVNLSAKTILLLGAGGAAQGVLAPLLAEKPALIVIANRTGDKALLLAEQFSVLGTIKPIALAELADINHHFACIINATSVGLAGKSLALPAHLIAANTVCYDMVYAKMPTPFLQAAQQLGAKKTIDGLGMLIEQAAEAFYVWYQVRPNTSQLTSQLRKMPW